MKKYTCLSLVALVAAQLLLALLMIPPVSAQTSPIKPPAVPLVTRGPYVNTWLANSTDTAPRTWPTFWNGNTKGMTGLVYIDGKGYVFLGSPWGMTSMMTQTALTVTATQSIFTFQAGGIALTVDFLSPIEATDIKRLSIPLGYIKATARSVDGQPHRVSVYFDISGEWANGNSGAMIDWGRESIAQPDGSLWAWHVVPHFPAVFNETNDYPDWGTALLCTASDPSETSQSGQDSVVRGQFVTHGKLTGSVDADQPRPINDEWPVFAFSRTLGSVGSTPTTPFVLLIGHVRDPAVSYLGQYVSPLWKSYWPTYEKMLTFADNDAGAAFVRAQSLDSRIHSAAVKVGGVHYAALTALTLRQAFAGTELVQAAVPSHRQGSSKAAPAPWLFLKEISSDGNVSTVDVVYPSCPVFLYANPELLRMLIDPLIAYAESGHWPQPFAEHDLGSSYPNASGHNNGGGENMPVEESADMLIMTDAYLRAAPRAEAVEYARAHYKLLKQWANYLLEVPKGVEYPNALDPQFQNQTDDFTGQIAHSVNLALKGIIAVGAMGDIAATAGNHSDAANFGRRAQSMIGVWMILAQNSDSTHLLLQYREAANPYSPDTMSEPDTAWSLKYNSFADNLLGLNLIPKSVLAEEAKFYKTQATPIGFPLDYRNPYTKADWEIWTAAGIRDASLEQEIFDAVYNWANTTACATPMPDWYWLGSTRTGFAARPVMGGAFAPLLAGSSWHLRGQ